MLLCLVLLCPGTLGREGLDGGRSQAGESQERRGHRTRRRSWGADDQTTQTKACSQLPSKPEQVVHSHQGTSNMRLTWMMCLMWFLSLMSKKSYLDPLSSFFEFLVASFCYSVKKKLSKEYLHYPTKYLMNSWINSLSYKLASQFQFKEEKSYSICCPQHFLLWSLPVNKVNYSELF